MDIWTTNGCNDDDDNGVAELRAHIQLTIELTAHIKFWRTACKHNHSQIMYGLFQIRDLLLRYLHIVILLPYWSRDLYTFYQ